jgi:hypothetical protein
MTDQAYRALRDDVLKDIIVPDYKAQVASLVNWRSRWSKTSGATESLAHIALALGTVLSFAAGFFSTPYLAFMAGCCSTVCLVLLRFSTYAASESADRNTVLARLLNFLGIAPVPSIAEGAQADVMMDVHHEPTIEDGGGEHEIISEASPGAEAEGNSAPRVTPAPDAHLEPP